MSFDSGIIDFCIGMAFFYLILTLISTMINEYFIERWGSLRAKSLLEGISGLFYDSQLVAKFYTHPLIRGLYHDDKFPEALLAKAEGKQEQQANNSGSQTTGAGKKKTQMVANPFIKDSITDCMKPFEGLFKALPSYIPSRTFAAVLLDILRPVGEDGKLQDLRQAITAYGNKGIAGVLLPLIDAGQQEEEKARQNIEKFFDDTMDRVSGWFKRKARLCLIIVAAIVCILLNADSIMVGKMLWQDKELRAAVVAQAEKHKPEPSPTDKQKDKQTPGADKSTASSGVSTKKIKETADELSPFPLGWTFSAKWQDSLSQCSWTKWMVSEERKKTSGNDTSKDPHEVPVKAIDIIFKVIGLFFTTLAISLGAPFWTDLLNNFVNLRRTGKVPAKAGEEKK
jgi:hypothetical protein